MTEIAHAERAHALLSASGAHRWLNCTPSARLEDTLPDESSEDAEAGTLAHEISELKLRKHFIEPMGTRKFNNRIKTFKENPLFEEEMLHHTDTYLEYIQRVVHGFNSPPYIAIERKLNYSSYADEGFGTGDCLIIGGSTLYVIDFKYGKGVPVSAKDNPQMKLYALGAYTEYSFLYPIETVKVVIVQPRLDSISEDTIPVSDLLAWGESIKPIAAKAFAGEGEFVPGDHCRFCRAKATCRARSEQYSALGDFKGMKPPLISNDEVGAILEKASGLVSWAKALQGYALKEVLSGKPISGWKAVHGRGSRNYVDQDVAFKHLTDNGIEEAMLYERKPLTVPAVEKILKGKQYAELLEDPGHVVKSQGSPTLVPESDTRQAITRSSAQDDFKNDNGGKENE
jgi:hypothetical protein